MQRFPVSVAFVVDMKNISHDDDLSPERQKIARADVKIFPKTLIILPKLWSGKVRNEGKKS